MHLRKIYTKNFDLKQWSKGGGFKDFVVSTNFWIIKHQLIFTVYFPHQIGVNSNTRKYSKIRQIFYRTETFSNYFLPQTIREWNKPYTSICQAPLYSVFPKALLDFTRPTTNSTVGTNDVSGLKLLIRLRVDFNHLREHKFKPNFQDRLNPLCPWSRRHLSLFMRCQNSSNQRNVLFGDLNAIDLEILKMRWEWDCSSLIIW